MENLSRNYTAIRKPASWIRTMRMVASPTQVYWSPGESSRTWNNLEDGLQHLEYEERLVKLNMTTLRCNWNFQAYDFKSYDWTALTPPSFRLRDRASRKHDFQIVQHRGEGIRSVLRNSYYHRTKRTWSDLSRSVVNAAKMKIALINYRRTTLWNLIIETIPTTLAVCETR